MIVFNVTPLYLHLVRLNPPLLPGEKFALGDPFLLVGSHNVTSFAALLMDVEDADLQLSVVPGGVPGLDYSPRRFVHAGAFVAKPSGAYTHLIVATESNLAPEVSFPAAPPAPPAPVVFHPTVQSIIVGPDRIIDNGSVAELSIFGVVYLADQYGRQSTDYFQTDPPLSGPSGSTAADLFLPLYRGVFGPSQVYLGNDAYEAQGYFAYN
jgi:hypothetical protein